jgi:hypothetical protein
MRCPWIPGAQSPQVGPEEALALATRIKGFYMRLAGYCVIIAFSPHHPWVIFAAAPLGF